MSARSAPAPKMRNGRKHSSACTAAPMPPTPPTATQPVKLPGQPKPLAHDVVITHGKALTELYYDDQMSYLGCVDADDDSVSVISDVDTVTGEICSSADVASVCGDCEYAAVTEKPAFDRSASPTCSKNIDGAAYPAAQRPTRRLLLSLRRNDPYAYRVLPAQCYEFIDPAKLIEIVADDPETVVGARFDAGNALLADLIDVEQQQLLQVEAATANEEIDVYAPDEEDWRPVYDGEGPLPVDPVNGPVQHEATSFMGPSPFATSAATGYYVAAAGPRASTGDPMSYIRGDPTPQPSAVMCCYWKQGHCQMGDACWYSHEGTEDTPCHYGASCRKGHRQLVRSNPNIPAALTRKPAPVAPATLSRGDHAAAYENTPVSAYVPPRRYVHEPKPPKPSAPLAISDRPCPHCGAEQSVRTQEFPLYEGNRCRMALRGHCLECKRTFMMQA